MVFPSFIREAGRWVKRARFRALRALSADKARYNALLNQREIWQGRTRLDSFPREIQVGTNWTCNLRCFFCRRQTTDAQRLAALSPAEREIPPRAMERLFAAMPCAEALILTPLGEPLLYSGLDRFLERYRASGCRNLQLTTNGNATTERRARQLVEAGARRIYVSIDSADPAIYAGMRVGGSLEKVTDGLRYLNEAKARAGSEYPEIIIAATFLERNIAGLADLVRYAQANRIRKVSVQLMEVTDPGFESEFLGRHIPLTLRSLGQAKRVAGDLGVELLVHLALRNLLSARAADPEVARVLEQDPRIDMRGRTLMEKCVYPWTFLIVDTNGDARPCCWTSARYGNLNDQPFDEIWNSPTARRMRADFLAGRIPADCRGKFCRVDL